MLLQSPSSIDEESEECVRNVEDRNFKRFAIQLTNMWPRFDDQRHAHAHTATARLWAKRRKKERKTERKKEKKKKERKKVRKKEGRKERIKEN